VLLRAAAVLLLGLLPPALPLLLLRPAALLGRAAVLDLVPDELEGLQETWGHNSDMRHIMSAKRHHAM
jgi:hypothetical protein